MKLIILEWIKDFYLDINEMIKEEHKSPFFTFLIFAFFQIIFWGVLLAIIALLVYYWMIGLVVLGLLLLFEVGSNIGEKLQGNKKN